MELNNSIELKAEHIYKFNVLDLKELFKYLRRFC